MDSLILFSFYFFFSFFPEGVATLVTFLVTFKFATETDIYFVGFEAKLSLSMNEIVFIDLFIYSWMCCWEDAL